MVLFPDAFSIDYGKNYFRALLSFSANLRITELPPASAKRDAIRLRNYAARAFPSRLCVRQKSFHSGSSAVGPAHVTFGL